MKTIRQLDKKLWRIFSKYIRLRDCDNNGMGKCISCGKPIWVFRIEDKIHFNQQAHAGHYYNKGSNYRALKYDEKNVNLQCCHCNTFLEGNKQGYKKGLIKKYGEEVLQYLEIKKSNQCKWSYGEYEVLIKHYTQKLNDLLRERGIYGVR